MFDDYNDGVYVSRKEKHSRKKKSRYKKKEKIIKYSDVFIIRDMFRNIVYSSIRNIISMRDRVVEGLSSERIPVSLKLEIDQDYYTDFVVPKRDAKELSPFIVDLLKAYYYDESVRTVVDDYIYNNSVSSEALRQLDRIKAQHSRSVMTTSILEGQVNSARDHAEEGIPDYGMNSGSGSMDAALKERLDTLEKAIPDLTDKMEKMMEIVQSNANNSMMGMNPMMAMFQQFFMQQMMGGQAVPPNGVMGQGVPAQPYVAQQQPTYAPTPEPVPAPQPVASPVQETREAAPVQQPIAEAKQSVVSEPVVASTPMATETSSVSTIETATSTGGAEPTAPVKKKPSSFAKLSKSTQKD